MLLYKSISLEFSTLTPVNHDKNYSECSFAYEAVAATNIGEKLGRSTPPPTPSLATALNFAKFDAHTNPMFARLKSLKLHDIFLYLACFIYQFSNSSLPKVFDNIFSRINTRHIHIFEQIMENLM